MMKKDLDDDYWLRQAVKIARRSPQRRFKTGAVIVFKNNVISYGWSHVSRVHSSGLFSVHAEQHAINRCIFNRSRNLDVSRIFIATINRCGNIAITSAPCKECQKRIEKVGIAEVIYTTGSRQDLVAA